MGSTEQHGPHLPIGTDTIIVERLADDLSSLTGIMRAPALEYGVNVTRNIPGMITAGFQRKTLHRVMNELIESWEEGAGIEAFTILTAEAYEPHQEALSTIMTDRARVKVVDVFALEFGSRLDRPGGPVHGGELDTSLLLHLVPDLVRMEFARDQDPQRKRFTTYKRGSKKHFLADPTGPTGYPTLATAEKGAELYRFILDQVLKRCFGDDV